MSVAPLLATALTLAAPQQGVPFPLPPRTEQQPGVMAVVGATLYPVATPPVENGVLLVEGGKITAVGSADAVDVPAGARIVDVTGMTVMPGIVESHSHMGLKQLFRPETGSDNNELSKPINAEVRAVDGIATQDAGFRIALAGGITTMNITTGSRSFASGQAVVVKLRGQSIGDMYLAPGGIKLAMRIRTRNRWGTPVPEILDLLRSRFREAQAYEAAKAAHARGEGDAPPWNPQLEVMGQALDGRMPVLIHAHGVEAMRAAIALKDEFGLNVSVHHADATLELAGELAEKHIPISFGPILPFKGRDDPQLAGPVRLAALGGSVAFHQDHPDGPQYYLRQGAALLVRNGMPEADALRGLTQEGARMFHLEDRIGSLEVGKDADFIVLDGPPLDWESRVRQVYIEGVRVFRLPDDAPPRPATATRTATPEQPVEVAAPPAPAGGDFAIVGGVVRTAVGPAIPDGVVLVRDGRIDAVGARGQVRIPRGVQVVDARGLVVTPGFIDARTTVARGRGAGFDPDALIRGPDVRMADALEELAVPGAFGMEGPATAVHPWVMDGVTTAYVAPGTGNLVAGFGAVVKLAGNHLGPVLDPAAALHVDLGDDPIDRFDAPTTRQGMVALLREWLHAAREAAPGSSFSLGSPASAIEGLAAPAPWVRNDDLAAVLDGERTVRFHAHTPDDILTALRVADEFGLRAVVDGASGAHAVAHRLAAAGAAVVLGPAIGGAGGGGSPETFAHTVENAAILHRAGVPVAFSTEGASGRAVTVEGIVARGHGLDADATLRALTLDAARILGVDDRVGSLEAGKDADLVLWAGDPVGTWGVAEVVVVDGAVVFRRGG